MLVLADGGWLPHGSPGRRGAAPRRLAHVSHLLGWRRGSSGRAPSLPSARRRSQYCRRASDSLRRCSSDICRRCRFPCCSCGSSWAALGAWSAAPRCNRGSLQVVGKWQQRWAAAAGHVVGWRQAARCNARSPAAALRCWFAALDIYRLRRRRQLLPGGRPRPSCLPGPLQARVSCRHHMAAHCSCGRRRGGGQQANVGCGSWLGRASSGSGGVPGQGQVQRKLTSVSQVGGRRTQEPASPAYLRAVPVDLLAACRSCVLNLPLCCGSI